MTVAITPGLLPAMTHQCARCGAPLADDQRYCIACGERRGDPRLPFMDGRSAVRAPVAPEPVAPPPPPRSRWSSGATLVAGVGTLLLALGVGVLIGRAGQDDARVAAAPPQVITVQGGGGTAAAATTATTATTDAPAAKAAGTKKRAEAKRDTSTATEGTQEQQQAAQAVVKGAGNVPTAKTPVVKKGQTGSGPGYKDGKFTGDFFGP
jgi:hypothetical protein